MGLYYLAHLHDESPRFRAALATAAAGLGCCRARLGADDLLWHLSEVQWLWGTIVQQRPDDPYKAEAEIVRATGPGAGLTPTGLTILIAKATTTSSGRLSAGDAMYSCRIAEDADWATLTPGRGGPDDLTAGEGPQRWHVSAIGEVYVERRDSHNALWHGQNRDSATRCRLHQTTLHRADPLQWAMFADR